MKTHSMEHLDKVLANIRANAQQVIDEAGDLNGSLAIDITVNMQAASGDYKYVTASRQTNLSIPVGKPNDDG